MEKNHENAAQHDNAAQGAHTMILRDAVMTAYSITGSLSAATTLCSSLVDENLPEQYQAAAVLTRLHHIAMSRPKH